MDTRTVLVEVFAGQLVSLGVLQHMPCRDKEAEQLRDKVLSNLLASAAMVHTVVARELLQEPTAAFVADVTKAAKDTMQQAREAMDDMDTVMAIFRRPT